MTIKQRTRAGTYDTFERRYTPVEMDDGSIMRGWRDVPPDTDQRNVWTVVDCDGKLYLCPGYVTVNYLGRVLCANPWPEVEASSPGYVY
jgi:hypothetical protein